MDNSRRKFIKNSTAVSTSLLTTPVVSFNILRKNKIEEEKLIGHGDYMYRVIRDWAKLSVAHNPILNCHEMVMDSKGRLIMIGDHTDNNIMIFDKSGKLLDTWGTRYPGGHGLTLSQEGEEDFLFITDCGWFQDRAGKWTKQAGVVSKTTIEGRLLFNLPDPRLVGIYKMDEPFLPTETAIGPNGDIYVADGYGSDYIIQYSTKGEYIRRFGGHHNENKNHNISNAHGVAIDYRDRSKPVLVVTSRNENCFKYFTLEGEYIKTVKLDGLFVCRPVIDDNNLYAGVCWSNDREGKRLQGSGFVTIMEGDKVVSNPGGTAPQYIGGKLQNIYQSSTKVFEHGHDVCIDNDKNLYVCQWRAGGSAPIKLERV